MPDAIITVDNLLEEISDRAQGWRRYSLPLYSAAPEIVGREVRNFAPRRRSRPSAGAPVWSRGTRSKNSGPSKTSASRSSAAKCSASSAVTAPASRRSSRSSSRITEPTDGRVTIHGKVASLLEVGTGFHPGPPPENRVRTISCRAFSHSLDPFWTFNQAYEISCNVRTFQNGPAMRFTSTRGLSFRLEIIQT